MFTPEDLKYIHLMDHRYLKDLWLKLDKKKWKSFTHPRRQTLYYKGLYYSTTELARVFGINKFTLSTRIRTKKWSVDKAIHTKVMQRKNFLI